MKSIYFAYALSTAIRIAGFYLYGFLILIAEAFHSLTDILILTILRLSSKVSEKPADHSHPLGHGLAGNVGALIAGVAFISILSYELLKESVSRLLSNEFPDQSIYAGMMMALSLIPVLTVLYYTSGKGKSPEMVALKYELRNDLLTGISGLIAIFLSGYILHLDALVTFFIALVIAYNGFRLIRDNARFLLGFSPGDEFYEKISDVIGQFSEVNDVHDIIATYMSPDKIHVDLHITVDGDMKVRDADRLTEVIVEKMQRELPEIEFATIHVCSEGKERLRATYDKIVKK